MNLFKTDATLLGAYDDPMFRPNFAVPYELGLKYKKSSQLTICKSKKQIIIPITKNIITQQIYFFVTLNPIQRYDVPKYLETSLFAQIWAEGIRYGRDLFVLCIMKNFKREKKKDQKQRISEEQIGNVILHVNRTKLRNVVKNYDQIEEEQSQRLIDEIKIRFQMVFGNGFYEYWVTLRYQVSQVFEVYTNMPQPIQIIMELVGTVLLELQFR
ncbi:hypothetical protein SS50377_23975 [Spironucleus salmonicida]|uniref:Uncharacterized protein n=1 Tax=Spironucleus salmonicida TaxID=348837 RepID=V6LQ83_9EUKA|nr:hypothetical protein SS50377_23975 [Spironucleus salmonicida]|eukprot:EST42919.1 Hypothetical protein SS50377_17452 [Spironucleus salmonicida]